MGMSLLWFTAAAKKKKEESQKEKNNIDQKKDYNDYDNIRKRNGYNLTNPTYEYELQDYCACIAEEIKDETTELAQFFKLLQEENRIMIEEKKKEYEAEKNSYILKLREICPHFDKLQEELQKKELQVQHNLHEEYSNHLFLTFNNLIKINGEQISYFFENVKHEYNYITQDEEEDKMNLRNLKAEVYLARKKSKKAKFNKKTILKDLESLEKKLEKQKEKYEKNNYKKKIETLKKLLNLKGNEKELVQKTLEELMASLTVRDQVGELVTKIKHINDTTYDDERMVKIIERLMKQGKITEDQLVKVFLSLDKIADKKTNGEYSRRQIYYNNEYPYRTVKAFVKNIYQRNRLPKENTKTEEELSKTR